VVVSCLLALGLQCRTLTTDLHGSCHDTSEHSSERCDLGGNDGWGHVVLHSKVLDDPDCEGADDHRQREWAPATKRTVDRHSG
jgi:hypothetical protein